MAFSSLTNESVDIFKDFIAQEIKNEDDQDLGLKTAQRLLGIPSIDRAFNELKAKTLDKEFRFVGAGEERALRPYQSETLSKLKELIDAETPVVGVQLPTGAGKTFLIHAYLYKNLLKARKNVLVIVPSWEIANQHAMTMCQNFSDGEKRVRRLGGRGQLISGFPEMEDGERGMVILTTSSLFYARQAKLADWLKVGLVVIDEGHHGYKKKKLNSVQAFAGKNAISTVLLTATPPANMEALPFAVQLSYLDLVPEFLVPCHVIRLETGEEFDPVLKNGVLSQKSRNELSSRDKRFQTIVAKSLKHIKGQTIYYAGSVREAMGVVGEFAKHGVKSVVVHSKWKSKGERINSLAIEKFKNGEAQVLVNVQMLAMGFDVPRVETIIVARPVESDTLFTQMVGRGARLFEGKDKFILIDVHDTIYKPEVAKVFEHKHVFYAGKEQNEVVRRRAGEILPVVRLVKALPKNVGGFPYHFAKIEWPKPDVSGLRYLTLQGSNEVVNYLYDYERLKTTGGLAI